MKVLNLRHPMIGATWAAALSFGFTIPAQAQVGNPNLIPAKSAYVISVPDAKALWTAWKGNAIYESFKKVTTDPQIAEQMGGFNKELKTIEDVLGYKLDGETMSSIFKNADIYIGPGENAGSQSGGAIMGIADKDKLNKLLDLAEKAATSAVTEAEAPAASDDADAKPASGPKKKATPAAGEKDGTGGADDTEATKAGDAKSSGPITSETYSGVTVKRFASGEENEIYYALAGDLLLVSNARSEIKALVDRSKATAAGTDTLGASEGYKKISAALAERKGEAYVFGSQKEAMEMQAGGGMEAFRELTQQLSPIDVYGASVKIEPKQINNYSYGILSGNTSDSLIGRNPGDKPLQAIKYVPAETLIAVATSLMDSEMIYKLAGDAASAAGNKGLEDQMKSAELMLGFSVKNDLIPALGNEFAFAINSVTVGGGSTPSADAALVFSVRDKDKMTKVLNGLEKLATNAMASQETEEPEETTGDDTKKTPAKKTPSAKAQAPGFKDEKVGEATIRYVDSPALFGFTPGYVLADNFLVIGGSKESMANSLKVKTENKSLADSEAVKALGPRITTTGNMFQYFNFSGIWKTGDMFAQMIPNPMLVKAYEGIKVLKTAAGVSSVKENAVISEGVLLLN